MCLFDVYAQDAYYSDYPDFFEDSKKRIFKFKGSGVLAKSVGSGFPAKSNSSNQRDLVVNGVAGDISAAIFFTNHIATEFSLGVQVYRTKQSVIDGVLKDFGKPDTKALHHNLYAVPATVILQYHIAPFGGISPYFGGGYGLAYLFTDCKAFHPGKIEAVPVLQVGLDMLFTDDTIFTFEVKKYLLTTKILYNAGFLVAEKDMNTELRINPLIVSVGLGFKF